MKITKYKLISRLYRIANKFKRQYYKKIFNFDNEVEPIIDNSTGCSIIIFSKDRAMQLHVLLSSYYEKVINPVKIYILYTYSSARHEKSYLDIQNIFDSKNIEFILETNFRRQLIKLLNNLGTKKMFFLVDDNIFIKNIDLKDFAKYNTKRSIPTLIKGIDATYCQTHDKYQDIPNFLNTILQDKDKKCWIWSEAKGSPDWSYPLGVVGNLFSTKEITFLTKNTYFKAPNSYEGNMQFFNKYFSKKLGICYNETIVASIPINLVNTEVNNKTTNAYSPDYLLNMWEQGYQIDYKKLYNIPLNNLLRLKKLEFITRKN